MFGVGPLSARTNDGAFFDSIVMPKRRWCNFRSRVLQWVILISEKDENVEVGGTLHIGRALLDAKWQEF